MNEPVLVVDADERQCSNLCRLLEGQQYSVIPLHSLANLGRAVSRNGCQVVLVDLDNLPVENRVFRKLKKTNPALRIFGLSSRPFHPELQEAMSKHIYVNLSKPLDVDELIYWLRSICENDADLRDPPET